MNHGLFYAGFVAATQVFGVRKQGKGGVSEGECLRGFDLSLLDKGGWGEGVRGRV